MKRRDFLGFLGATIAMSPQLVTAQQSAADPLRILIIANTTFEADPLMAVLGNEEARHRHVSMPREVVWPRTRPETDIDVIKRPRCVIDFKQPDTKAATIEVWCIGDMMSKAVDRSSSDEKARVLPDILAFGKSPDGVIAFGTGAFPSDESKNGCVTVGSTVFIHDAKGGRSHWSWKDQMEKLVTSKIPNSFYSALAADQEIMKINEKMLPAPINTAAQLTLMVSLDAVAISSVNIASSADYARVDREAVDLAKAAGATMITSVETTHGVIRAQSDAPFIYVTGIPNRMGHFSDEAFRKYPQNFAAAHNAGVVAAYIIPIFVKEISK